MNQCLRATLTVPPRHWVPPQLAAIYSGSELKTIMTFEKINLTQCLRPRAPEPHGRSTTTPHLWFGNLDYSPTRGLGRHPKMDSLTGRINDRQAACALLSSIPRRV